MAIPRPVTKTIISTSAWGIPITDAVNNAPGTEIYYGEVPANINVTAISAATAQSVINPGNITYDGSPIILEFFCPYISMPNVAAANFIINLWETNTDLGFWLQWITPNAGSPGQTAYGMRRIVPVAGQRNYNVRAWIFPSGTGQINSKGGYSPAFFRISRA